MKYKVYTVFTNHDDSELVSSAMFDAGAGGVTILDKQDFLELVKSDVIWDYVDSNVIEAGDEVKVSTVASLDDVGFADRLRSCLKNIEGITYSEIIEDVIDEADYANEWKKYYKPIKTRAVTIVPTWIKYAPQAGECVMRLDPGMAFGTGAHATTRMCLELMEVKGKDVIDVGCGSGILGIAAALTGAKSVYMCDIDEQAVKAAKENAALNSVDACIECADLIAGDLKADVVLANLTADILMRLAGDIGKHLRRGGELVVSGVIDSREDEVKERFFAVGFELANRLAEDDWRAFKFKLKE